MKVQIYGKVLKALKSIQPKELKGHPLKRMLKMVALITGMIRYKSSHLAKLGKGLPQQITAHSKEKAAGAFLANKWTDIETHYLPFLKDMLSGVITHSMKNGGVHFSFDGGLTYQNAVLDNSNSITYSNRSAGIYNLWTRWSSGDCAMEIGTFTLSNNQQIRAAIAAPKYVCVGSSATLNAAGVGGISPYNFTWINGVSSTNASITVSPTVSTIYTIRVIDGNSCVAFESVRLVADPCTEDCNNGIYDDGDGLIDCADNECKPDRPATIINN